MHIIFRTLCFIAFLSFFTALAIYFPLPEIATKCPPEAKEPILDLNQFAGRVKQCDLPKLLSSLLDDQNRARSSGFIYIYSKDEDEDGDDEIYKVGRTASTVGVDKRLKQWKRKCKKRLRLEKKFFLEQNHELCESMIHLELKSKGLWCGYLFCETCSGSHKEFFKADLKIIIECCYFWVDYFNELEKNKYQLM